MVRKCDWVGPGIGSKTERTGSETGPSPKDVEGVYSRDVRGACLEARADGAAAEEQMSKEQGVKNLVSTQRLDHNRGR